MTHEDASQNKLNPISSEKVTKDLPYFIRYGQGGAIGVIPDGGLIPIGGSMLGEDMTEILLRADISAFDKMFDEVLAGTEAYEPSKMKEWMCKAGIITDTSDFPIDTFRHLYVFTGTLAKMYPVNLDQQSTRESEYKHGKKTLDLSYIMDHQLAACAEYAALAQAYLQKVCIASTWFSGDLLLSRDREFAAKHTFIILHLNQGDFIYDPARPVHSTSGAAFPRLVRMSGSFPEQMRLGNGRRFVAGYDLLLKQETFYGLSRGGNIMPERDIV
jgi:hypothetical protein